MSRRLDLRSRCLSEGGVGRESSRPQETLVVVDERRPRPALSELGLTNRAAPRFGDAILSRTRRRRKGASARGRPAGRVFARATAVCHDMLGRSRWARYGAPMAVIDELPRRRRVARLSLLAVALIGLTLMPGGGRGMDRVA